MNLIWESSVPVVTSTPVAFTERVAVTAPEAEASVSSRVMMALAVGAIVRSTVLRLLSAKLAAPVQDALDRGIDKGLVTPVGRTAAAVAVARADAETGAALADVVATKGINANPKAPAATPASVRLPVRIALDNAFPFVNAHS